MKDENHVYRIAQKINDYDEEEDGCIWSHILEFVEKAYLLGKESKQKSYDLNENGVTSSPLSRKEKSE